MIGQFIVNGLITGILYSLLTIGIALVYNTTRIFHIVAGIYVFAAYIFWFFTASQNKDIRLFAYLVSGVLTMLIQFSRICTFRPFMIKKELLFLKTSNN